MEGAILLLITVGLVVFVARSIGEPPRAGGKVAQPVHRPGPKQASRRLVWGVLLIAAGAAILIALVIKWIGGLLERILA